ncbi:MAG: hypothetical protein ACT4QE_02475 [Anaerolineales bacterium]
MGLKSKPLDSLRQLPLSEVTKEDLVRINLNVPKGVRKEWKSAALLHEKTLTDLIVEAMNAYLRK